MGIVRAGGCDLQDRNAIRDMVKAGYTADQIYRSIMVQMPVIESYVKFFQEKPAKKKKE